MLPSICPRCGTLNYVGKSGISVNCVFCLVTYTDGDTPLEYEEQVRRLELEAFEDIQKRTKEKEILEEKEKKELKKRLKDIKRRMRTNPEVRSTEYLEHLQNGGFPTKAGLSTKAHIYVLELNEPEGKLRNNHTFPNQEFPILVRPGDPGFKGFVYVGHTQRVPNHKFDLKEYEGNPILYRFYKEHLTGKKGSKVVTKHHSSKDFELCGRNLTNQYGFSLVSIVKPSHGELESYKLESWVGYMLYKLGYWVWGPHAHCPKHRDRYGEFLGKEIYL